MKVRAILPAVVAATVFSTSARMLHAQGLSVFAMGTVSSLYAKNLYSEFGTDFQSSYKVGGGLTLGAEFRMNRILGVEGSYTVSRNNLAVTNTTNSSEQGYGIHNQRFAADAVAHAPISFLRLKPYLAAGVEFDHFSAPSSTTFSGLPNVTFGAANKVGVNYGGGVDWGFLPHIALRIDVRDHLTGIPTYGFPSSAATRAYFPVSGLANNLEYSAGIVFHVG